MYSFVLINCSDYLTLRYSQNNFKIMYQNTIQKWFIGKHTLTSYKLSIIKDANAVQSPRISTWRENSSKLQTRNRIPFSWFHQVPICCQLPSCFPACVAISNYESTPPYATQTSAHTQATWATHLPGHRPPAPSECVGAQDNSAQSRTSTRVQGSPACSALGGPSRSSAMASLGRSPSPGQRVMRAALARRRTGWYAGWVVAASLWACVAELGGWRNAPPKRRPSPELCRSSNHVTRDCGGECINMINCHHYIIPGKNMKRLASISFLKAPWHRSLWGYMLRIRSPPHRSPGFRLSSAHTDNMADTAGPQRRSAEQGHLAGGNMVIDL